MEERSENKSVLRNGRWFTSEEIEDIQYIVKMFSHLSRNELAMTICEGISWMTPMGEYKINSCLELLEKLEAEKQIVLPEKRHTRSTKQEVILGKKTEADSDIQGTVSDVAPITLQVVRDKEDNRLWNEYVERYHYLGYKRPFGAYQRYFIWSAKTNKRLGCILFAASAWALTERDAWIGWEQEDRSQRLHLIINNTRFLIFPWVKVKNLASKTLSLAAKQVPLNWKERYGFEPVLLETFVDVEKYKGTCYQASNWVKLGLTAGRGRMDRYNKKLSSPKQIYMYPLRPDFRAILRGEGGEAK